MKARQAGLAFIFVTLVLDVLGIGIVIPILPEWGRFCNKPAQDTITWPIEIQLLIALRLAASGWESTMSRCAVEVAPRVQAAHDPYCTLLKPSDASLYDSSLICSLQRRLSKKGVSHFEVTNTLVTAAYQWVHLA